MSGRKTIARSTEQEVLVLSKRRCCICYALNSDAGTKIGQIAHLDSNAARSDLDNLVFLCLEHHDEFDSSSSQSKGLVPGEVREYRQDLYAFNSREPIWCGLVLEINCDFDEYSTSEQKKLLRAIASLSCVGDGVRVVSIRRGSVFLTLELTLAQARAIVSAIQHGALDAYSVVGAELIYLEDSLSDSESRRSGRAIGGTRESGRAERQGIPETVSQPVRGRKIFVSNLSINTTETTLRNLFSAYGSITSATVMSDRETGRPRGFGFVEMSNDDEARAAIQGLDGKNVDGRCLKVNEARPKAREGGDSGPRRR